MFLRNAEGFDLALMPDPVQPRFPAWFHFGFRLDSASAVRELHDRMTAARVPVIRPLHEDGSLISFRCADPDGYAVEVYWE